MRIAHISPVSTEETTESEELELELIPAGWSFDTDIFANEKAYKQFVIQTKYYIRNSYEYKKLMKFLKDERHMDHCGVHPNVSRQQGFQIQIHHTPFTLEDILCTVIQKRQVEKESLKISDIAEEVMYLHYLGLVGLYPLCETCHEYAHSDANDLFIPLNKIYGEPEAFVDIYKKYLEDTPLLTKFDNIRILNKSYGLLEEMVPLGLRKKYIYVRLKSKDGKEDDNAALIVSNQKLYDLVNSDKILELLDGRME